MHKLSKSQFPPAQLAVFLGVELDMQRAQFRVPQPKLARLRGMLQQLLRTWSHKLWQSARGLLASFSDGLRLTALLGRWLRSVGNGELEDGLVHAAQRDAAALGPPLRAELVQLVQFVDDNMEELNGKPWRAALQPACQLVANASESQYGDFVVTPGGAASPSRLKKGR